MSRMRLVVLLHSLVLHSQIHCDDYSNTSILVLPIRGRRDRHRKAHILNVHHHFIYVDMQFA